MTQASEIRLCSVTKTFGDSARGTQALADVSFQVPAGTFVSLLGPSGCGKSTLIALIAGFIQPTSGQIFAKQQPVKGPDRDRTVVFQELYLFPWKSVRANVEIGLKAAGVARAERRREAERYLDLVYLSDFAERYPYELSGGMRQRLAIARALAVKPGCILMDEPLGSLDHQLRRALQDELLRIWSVSAQTILMVTHDVDEAIYMSDSVVVLTPRPGSVRAVVDVPLPRPRMQELRLSAEFQAVKHEVMQHLTKQTGT